MKNIIIKLAVVFIISFICFNQGANDIFDNHIITLTSISMVVMPVYTVVLFILYEAFKQAAIAAAKRKPETIKNTNN